MPDKGSNSSRHRGKRETIVTSPTMAHLSHCSDFRLSFIVSRLLLLLLLLNHGIKTVKPSRKLSEITLVSFLLFRIITVTPFKDNNIDNDECVGQNMDEKKKLSGTDAICSYRAFLFFLEK